MTQKSVLGSDFPKRLLTALIGGPIVILLIYLGSPFSSLMVGVIGVICAFELWGMFRPSSQLGLLTTLSVTLACIMGIANNNPIMILLILGFCISLGIIESLFAPEKKRRFFVKNYVYAILGAVYVGLPLGILILLRNQDHGFYWTGVLFANSWITDAFALISGRLVGHHKLAPQISPGKTVEGAVIGMIFGTLVGWVLMLVVGLAPTSEITILAAFVINFVMANLTVAGDLFESWLKRNFHVKDASFLLPGHGGFLDRLDGFAFAVPSLYAMLWVLHYFSGH